MAAPEAVQSQTRAEVPARAGDIVVTGIPPGTSVRLRGGAGNFFPGVGTVRQGQVLTNLGCDLGLTGRWCHVETRGEARNVRGWISGDLVTISAGGAPPPPPGGDDNLTGGPDFWRVAGVPAGQRLNLRREPGASARVLATLREGEVVRNLGCRLAGGARWCRIRSTEGVDVTGWVSGRFLQESGPPQAGGGGGGGQGADVVVVAGLPAGDRLNIRAEASARSRILGTLGAGERVQNLGCQTLGSARWCRIRTLSGARITGWVNGRFLTLG